MITIRDAHLDDAPVIATAHVAAWRTGYRGVFPDAYLDGDEIERTRREGWPRRLALGARRPDRELDVVLAAEIDGRVVGFGHVGAEDVGEEGAAPTGRGEVYGFYLHPTRGAAGQRPS